MYDHDSLAIERELATARRAIYRAIGRAESAASYGLEDDLHQVQVELARILDDVMRRRPGLMVSRDVRA
jgi:outer membrane protein TolC